MKTASDEVGGSGGQEGIIHIRIQQRNGRKTLTTVQGISKDYDFKKIVKACKKVSFIFLFLTLTSFKISKKKKKNCAEVVAEF